MLVMVTVALASWRSIRRAIPDCARRDDSRGRRFLNRVQPPEKAGVTRDSYKCCQGGPDVLRGDVALSRLGVHRDAAHRLGLRLVERPVRTEDEARSVISTARKSELDGIFSTRLLSLNIPGLILEIAPKRTMPTMFDDAFYVERGGELCAEPLRIGAPGRAPGGQDPQRCQAR